MEKRYLGRLIISRSGFDSRPRYTFDALRLLSVRFLATLYNEREAGGEVYPELIEGTPAPATA